MADKKRIVVGNNFEQNDLDRLRELLLAPALKEFEARLKFMESMVSDRLQQVVGELGELRNSLSQTLMDRVSVLEEKTASPELDVKSVIRNELQQLHQTMHERIVELELKLENLNNKE